MKSLFHHNGQSIEVSSSGWRRLIRDHGFGAVIFDCDGTLVESAAAHAQCMLAASAEQGQHMPSEWYRARTGLDRISLFQAFAQSLTQPFDVDRACATSIDAYAEFVHLAEPIPETISLLLELGATLPVAVATNAEQAIAERSLEKIAIKDKVGTLVTISDGVAPKPSPEMFLLAARRLGTAPQTTLVFEDSPQGVNAAKAAGMSVFEVF